MRHIPFPLPAMQTESVSWELLFKTLETQDQLRSARMDVRSLAGGVTMAISNKILLR